MNFIVAFCTAISARQRGRGLCAGSPNFPGMSVSEIGASGSTWLTRRARATPEVHPFEPMMRVEIFCRAAEFVARCRGHTNGITLATSGTARSSAASWHGLPDRSGDLGEGRPSSTGRSKG